MKCVITGHTRGIGKSLYEYFVFKGWKVIGFSTSTGHDIRECYDTILKEARTADLFVNNLCVDDYQIKFLHDLNGKIKRIINCGSIAGDYDDLLNINYSRVKKELKQLCKHYSLQGESNILHLNITMAEDAKSTDYGIPYTDIVNAVDFWMDNPRVNNIEFDLLLTPYTKEKIKQEFGVDWKVLLQIKH
jgi:NAD(P)-dependent dehydrogenase (short-subunit alcohol dehydrogenase family)